MSKPSLPQTSKSLSSSIVVDKGTIKRPRKKSRRNSTNGDVVISAVVSSYLLTHLQWLETILTNNLLLSSQKYFFDIFQTTKM